MRSDDLAFRKLVGLLWAMSGGMLAGQSLVFAKSAYVILYFLSSVVENEEQCKTCFGHILSSSFGKSIQKSGCNHRFDFARSNKRSASTLFE
jgi:hypothetical protein